MLAVSGRQWITYLTSFASRKVKNSNDVVAHDSMRCTAEKYVGQMFNVLNPVLIGAIIMFLVGLLFQLWSILISLNEITSTLFTTSVVGAFLCFVVGVLLLFTLVHALLHEKLDD